MDVLISDLIKKYDKCRRLAKSYGSVVILKDNRPDAVLLTIDEFEKLSRSSGKSGNSSNAGVADLLMHLPKAGDRKVYTLDQLKRDLNLSNF